MPKVRITVEVEIPDVEDLPSAAQAVPHLVQAMTRTAKCVLDRVPSSAFPDRIGIAGACQGQAEVLGDGMENVQRPQMPGFDVHPRIGNGD